MIDLFSQSERKAKLQAWLAYNGVLKSDLAKALQVHPSMVTRMLRSDTAPARRIEQLKAFGIPEELLPAPSRSPGRPPKKTFHHRRSEHPADAGDVTPEEQE